MNWLGLLWAGQSSAPHCRSQLLGSVVLQVPGGAQPLERITGLLAEGRERCLACLVQPR